MVVFVRWICFLDRFCNVIEFFVCLNCFVLFCFCFVLFLFFVLLLFVCYVLSVLLLFMCWVFVVVFVVGSLSVCVCVCVCVCVFICEGCLAWCFFLGKFVRSLFYLFLVLGVEVDFK